MTDRLKRFEAWVATRDVGVRTAEVSRVAAELFEIAGDEALLELDVDALVKRYKEGLAGAQRVLAARRVGEAVLLWQDEELHPAPPLRAAEPEPAFEPSPGLSGFDGDRMPGLDLSEPPLMPESRGPKSVVPGPKVSTWARPAVVESQRPLPLFDADSDVGAEAPLGRAIAREVSLPSIEPYEDAPPRADAGLLPLPSALGPLATDLDVERGSVRPRARGSDAPAPHHSDLVAASKSSRPPPSLTAPAPLSGVGLMVSPASIAPRERVPLPPPSTGYPVGALASANLTSDRRIDGSLARLWGGIGFAVLIGIAVIIVVTRPGCMFADPGRHVTGSFVVKHLGLKLNFPELWLYGEDLDDKETDSKGYKRKISVFYQGTSATDYASKLEVITFTKEGEVPTEAIAANRGAAETLDQVRNRSCAPIVRGTVRGTRCTSISQQLGSPAPYSTIEYYFPLGPMTVFARGRVKMASPFGGNLAPMDGPPRENTDVADRVDQIEDIIDSIDIAR